MSVSSTTFIYVLLYIYPYSVGGGKALVYSYRKIIPSLVLCVEFVLLVITRFDIRMSVGTSDVTAISSVKPGSHNFNTTNVSAPPGMNSSSSANLHANIAENRHKV